VQLQAEVWFSKRPIDLLELAFKVRSGSGKMPDLFLSFIACLLASIYAT